MKISANFAISADGKITCVRGRPSGWTSSQDHARLLELRKTADAILVSHGTLKADRMTLTVAQQPLPLRCIISHAGEISPDEKIFHTLGAEIIILSTYEPKNKIPHVTYHIGNLLEHLAWLEKERGITQLHCEGGGMLMRELLKHQLVDTLHITWAAHTLFGGNAPTLTSLCGDFFPSSLHYKLTHFAPIENEGEVFLTYEVQKNS